MRQENSEHIQEFLEVLNNLIERLDEVIESLENEERDSIPQEELEGINTHTERIVTQFQNTPLRRDIEAIAQSLAEFKSRPATLEDLSKLKGIKRKVKVISTPINLRNTFGRRKFLYIFSFFLFVVFGVGIAFFGETVKGEIIKYTKYNNLETNYKTLKNNYNTLKAAHENLNKKYLTIDKEFRDFSEKSWKMASFLGAGYENQILYTPPEKVAQLVSDMTNGRFKIEVSYPKKEDYQQGYSTTKLLKDVQDNKIDAAYSGIYYEIEGPSLSLFFSCAIPFGLTPQEQIAWLNYKIIDDKDDVEKKYIQYLLEKYYDNMLIFPVACTGMQMGGWFQKPINEIGDLSGIKMRIPGIGKVILQDDKFGVLSRCQDVDAVGKCKDARIPGHEIKERLKTGQIDAAEWIGPHEDKQLGIHQLPEELNNTWYYYYPGWWEPSTTFSIHVNKNSWEDLGKSRAYKEIFKSACSRVLYETLAEYNEKNGKALADLKAKYQGKIEIRRFSPEILEAVEQATDDYFKEKADKTDGFIDIWTTFNDFKKDIRQWSKIEAYYVDYKDNLE